MEKNAGRNPRHFLLQEAIDLMRAKHPKEAYPTLIQYLRIHPKSEEGWLLLSYVVREPEKKIDCLERVLKINPINEQASQRIEKLSDLLPPKRAEATKLRQLTALQPVPRHLISNELVRPLLEGMYLERHTKDEM